jgi:1-acyl-sn-glycerol-3-phosphate acyltransferase
VSPTLSNPTRSASPTTSAPPAAAAAPSSSPATAGRRPGAGGDAGQLDLPEHRTLTHVLQGVNRFLTRAFHRLDVLGPCRLPKAGPAIVVCNHTSGLDPHLIQSCCPRLICWMMAKEYFELPVLNSVLRQVGIIPVSRTGRDTAAMRAAMRALESGQLLGLFPEGKIAESRDLLPFQTGVALMAFKTGVPVYPAYLNGTQRNTSMVRSLLVPQRAQILFGDEVALDRSDASRDGLTAATEAIQSAVAALQRKMDNARRQREL